MSNLSIFKRLMNYSDNIGTETIGREFKAFSFPFNLLNYSNEQLEQFIKDGKWNFNSLIKRTLTKYLDNYMPRYLCGFFDKKSETSSGEFFIGVNDDGLIHGIPYQGDLTSAISSTMILEYIKNMNFVIEDETWHSVCDNCVCVEWVEVEYKNDDEYALGRLDKLFTTYLNKKKAVDRLVERRLRKYAKWQRHHAHFSQKLVDLYNHMPSRKKFEKYVKKYAPDSVYQEVKNGVEMKQKRFHEIQEYRKHEDNIYYWICKWKDANLYTILKNKPKPIDLTTLNSPFRYGPIHMFSNMQDIIPKWMFSNENMKIHLLKISVARPDEGFNISYHTKSNDVLKYYRTIHNGQPCCLPK